MEELPPDTKCDSKTPVETQIAIAMVKNNWMANCCKVTANLMLAPGFYFSFHESARRNRKGFKDFKIRLGGDYFFRCAGWKRFGDDMAARNPLHERQIFFLRFWIAKNIFERLAVTFVFSKHQDTRSLRIEPMKEIRSSFLF